MEPRVKIKSTFREFFEIAITSAVLAIAFGIFFSGGADSLSDPPKLVKMSLISLAVVSSGFMIHELGHRLVARKYGYIATYSLWIPGLLLAIITSFFSWIFAAPGAVWIRSKASINEDSKDYLNHLGKISIAGPLVNFYLALAFLFLSYFYITTDGLGSYSETIAISLTVGAYMNGNLAAFNLIPLGPFDGRKIFKWSKMVWFTTTAIAVGLFLFILSAPFEIEKTERTLLSIPAFQAMKQYDLPTYKAIITDLKEGLRQGRNKNELIAQIKPRMESFIQKRLPLASDQAIVTYMEVMVREIRELNKQDPELCYKFLFPQQYGVINVQKYLPKEIIDADFASLVQVIKTSAKNPQSVPNKADVSADLELVVATLRKQHGESITVLQNLQDPSVSKSEYCRITADMYDNVLALPLDRSSKVLRFLLSRS